MFLLSLFLIKKKECNALRISGLVFSLSSNFDLFWNSKKRSSFSSFFKGTILWRIFIVTSFPVTVPFARQSPLARGWHWERGCFHRTNVHLVEDLVSSFPVLHCLYGYRLTAGWIFGIQMKTFTLQKRLLNNYITSIFSPAITNKNT